MSDSPDMPITWYASATPEQFGPLIEATLALYRAGGEDEISQAWADFDAATLVFLDQLGRCEQCYGPRCPECKVCPLCAGDGHDEGCSRQGDEYTPELRVALFGEMTPNGRRGDL